MKVIKIIWLPVIVVLIAATAYWMTTNTNKAPVIEIPVVEHDFGQVRYGDVPSHEFVVLNSGNQTLNIEKISTSCGCTTAEISSEIIEPGDEAVLTVYFNPAVHGDDTDLGELTRVVYLVTNDPQEPESEVKIRANVYKE